MSKNLKKTRAQCVYRRYWAGLSNGIPLAELIKPLAGIFSLSTPTCSFCSFIISFQYLSSIPPWQSWRSCCGHWLIKTPLKVRNGGEMQTNAFSSPSVPPVNQLMIFNTTIQSICIIFRVMELVNKDPECTSALNIVSPITGSHHPLHSHTMHTKLHSASWINVY